MTDAPKPAALPDGSRVRNGASGGVEAPEPLLSDTTPGDAAAAYWLTEDEVRVEMQGLSAGCPVVLLSSTVAWIEPDYHTEYPWDRPVGVLLRWRDREIDLTASLTLQSVGMRGPLIGLQLQDVSPRVELALQSLLRELEAEDAARPASATLLEVADDGGAAVAREIIEDPRRVRNVMSVLVKRKVIVRRGEDSRPPLCVLLDEVGADRVRWRGLEGWSDAATIDIVGYNSVFRFSVRGEQADRGEAISRLPVRIERIRRRLQRRSVASPDAELTASYVHPLWPHLPPVRGEVVDVSFTGMRIAAQADEHLLGPGLKVSLEMLDGEGEVIRLRGEVRAVVPADDASVHIGTFRVAGSSREDEQRWLRLVSRVLHATPDGGPIWREELWKLFDSSGYFNLSGKSPEHFELIKPRFLKMAKLAAEVPHLMFNAACLSERGIEGNFSIMKAYEGTWMLHQLAKRPRSALNVSSRQVLRDIYVRCIEHAQADSGLRWILAYAEAGVAWSDRCHFEFARRHASTGLVQSLPFRLMEVESAIAPVPGGPEDVRPAGDLTFCEATAAEQASLSRLLVDARPRAYVESLDFVPERFLLPASRAMWLGAGLERVRSVLVARRGGQAIAAAIVELGEIGTNLFRLLDSVRLVPLQPGGEAALAPLLDVVRGWFRAQNRPSFVYFREHDDPGNAGRPCIRDLGEGKLWIIGAPLVTEFVEHFYKLTAPKRPGG